MFLGLLGGFTAILAILLGIAQISVAPLVSITTIGLAFALLFVSPTLFWQGYTDYQDYKRYEKNVKSRVTWVTSYGAKNYDKYKGWEVDSWDVVIKKYE